MNMSKEAKRRLVTIAIVGSFAIGSTAPLVATPVANGAGPPPAPPGSSSKRYTGTAHYTQKGGTASRANQTYSATATDESGVLVTNTGSLTLTNSRSGRPATPDPWTTAVFTASTLPSWHNPIAG